MKHRLPCAVCTNELAVETIDEAPTNRNAELSRHAWKEHGWGSWQPGAGDRVWWYCSDGCSRALFQTSPEGRRHT